MHWIARSLWPAVVAFSMVLGACSDDSGLTDDQATRRAVVASRTAVPSQTPSLTTVTGTFVLRQTRDYTGPRLDPVTPTPRASCAGSGGYSDIAGGMEVTVLVDGKIVALGRFASGRVTRNETNVQTFKISEDCTFTFTLDVPPGAAFYVVKVGRRGERTYTWHEITATGTLAFSIGP
jgi:hypothetical protein